MFTGTSLTIAKISSPGFSNLVLLPPFGMTSWGITEPILQIGNVRLRMVGHVNSPGVIQVISG